MLEITQDPISERLDELADLSVLWKKHRDNNREPREIRSAMIVLSQEIANITEASLNAAKNTQERIDRLTSGNLEK